MTQAARWLSLRAPQKHPESDLQRAVAKWWALQYPSTWALTVHVPSGVAIDAKRAAVFKGLGWKRGIPDLLCFARKTSRHNGGLVGDSSASIQAVPPVRVGPKAAIPVRSKQPWRTVNLTDRRKHPEQPAQAGVHHRCARRHRAQLETRQRQRSIDRR